MTAPQIWWIGGPAGTGGANYLSGGAAWQALGATGVHSLVSNACLHGRHEDCLEEVFEIAGLTRHPQSCGYCNAECGCRCHQEGP